MHIMLNLMHVMQEIMYFMHPMRGVLERPSESRVPWAPRLFSIAKKDCSYTETKSIQISSFRALTATLALATIGCAK